MKSKRHRCVFDIYLDAWHLVRSSNLCQGSDNLDAVVAYLTILVSLT